MPYDAAGPWTRSPLRAKVADVEREALVDVALWATVPPRGPMTRSRASSTPARPRSSSRPSRPTPSASRASPTAQLLRAFAAIAPRPRRRPRRERRDRPRRHRGRAGRRPWRRSARPCPLAAARGRARGDRPAVSSWRGRPAVRLHICHVSTPRGVELVAARPGRRRSTSAPRPAPLPAARRVRLPPRAARPRSTRRCARGRSRTRSGACPRRRPHRPGHAALTWAGRASSRTAPGHSLRGAPPACRGSTRRVPLLFSEGVVRRGPPAGHAAAGAARRPGAPLRPGAAQGDDRGGRGMPTPLRSSIRTSAPPPTEAELVCQGAGARGPMGET